MNKKIKLGETFLLKNQKPVFFENNLVEHDRLNFIQVYAKGLPYFRASLKDYNLILKNFLEKMNIYFSAYSPDLKVPLVKGDDYELVGLGTISKAYSLDKKSKNYLDKYFIENSYSNNTYRDYRPGLSVECYYNKYNQIYPDKQHFLDIIEYFDKGLVFLDEKNPL